MNRRAAVAVLLVGVFGFSSLATAADKGWFGLSFNVETRGFSFNPTLQSVTIAKVMPASPAADAGLVAGDVIVASEGIAIAGAKANDLKKTLDKQVGQSLRLSVRHGAAEPHDVTLVAAEKPRS